MAKHMVKCFYCGEVFDASTTPYVKPNSRRYAHKTCAQTAEENKTQEEKDKEIKENEAQLTYALSMYTVISELDKAFESEGVVKEGASLNESKDLLETLKTDKVLNNS